MEDKYIDLLLNRCLNFDNSKSLLISYDRVNKDFVNKVVNKVHQMGIMDIYRDEEDINLTHSKLLSESLEEIEHDDYFDKREWDIYALKGSSFLMLESEFPHYMDDIDPNKIAKVKFVNRKSRPIFRHKETNYEIPWCIAALPNEIWARDIYGDNIDAYKKLEDAIYKMCMVNTENPIKNWEEYLGTIKKRTQYLNSLDIRSLHYTNSLGTDLTVSYPSHVIWSSVADDLDHNMIVNMPSYEIFTSPDYRKTNGIVYSSRPLMYGGGKIDKFFIEFKDGKVVNYDALVGYEILKGIIESDENACYLGETALVNSDSPISNTRLVFGTTLIDENASCHLALGDGFSMSILNGEKKTKEELLENGINQSQNHVDFMIGTDDMNIVADTSNGKVKIFEHGNFVE